MLQRVLDLMQQMSTHSVCCYIHLAEMWLNQEVITLPFHDRLILSIYNTLMIVS